MAKRNAAKMQNTTEKGVQSYSTSEYTKALAPGWRVPLARLAYCWRDRHNDRKCVSEVTFGLAAIAGVDVMILPALGRKKEFVVGTDLSQLLEAAGATEAEYVDVWRTTEIQDVWQNSEKARRYIVGAVQRYYPADGRWDATREMKYDITVLKRDVERYGIQPQAATASVRAVEKSVSRGCEVARAARRRQAERAANAKKPVTWRDGVAAPAPRSLLDLDGRVFANALAGTL